MYVIYIYIYVFWQIFCGSGSLCLSCTLFVYIYIFTQQPAAVKKGLSPRRSCPFTLRSPVPPSSTAKSCGSYLKEQEKDSGSSEGCPGSPSETELVIKKILRVELLLLEIRRSQVRCFGQEDRGCYHDSWLS